MVLWEIAAMFVNIEEAAPALQWHCPCPCMHLLLRRARDGVVVQKLKACKQVKSSR